MTTFIDLEGYKAWAVISSPNLDSQITPLLSPACIVVQDYIGFQLTINADGSALSPEKVFKYYFKHPHDFDILLPDWNAQVTGLELFLRNSTVTIPLPEVTNSDYYVDELAGVLHLDLPVSDRLGINVTYNYSNVLDESIKLATYMLIDYWRNKDFQMVKLQGGQSITSTPTRVLPKHVESILNAHRII
jgi:hypothetical protein